MKLTLHHVANRDISGTDGYWDGKPVCAAKQIVTVATLKDAANALREWCDRYGLGSGNMARDCGDVRDDAGKVVARVSYNGRCWQPGEWPTAEIAI